VAGLLHLAGVASVPGAAPPFDPTPSAGCCIPHGAGPSLKDERSTSLVNVLGVDGTMALTRQQRHRIEKRLLEERARVLSILRRFDDDSATTVTAASGDLSDYPFHVADHGTDSYDQEMDTVQAERASRELEEINDALRRLYEEPDRFGVCENTGDPIPMERLEIIPWARTCVAVDAV
jgi:DnaK suppressor protein